MALASQVVSLGVSSAILQDCRQCDNCVQEHILPDLTQCNVDMTFKEELECIRLVLKLEVHRLAFSKMLLGIKQQFITLALFNLLS